jgi:hypothetical protein
LDLFGGAFKSFAVTFATRDLFAMALLLLEVHQEAEKQKPPTSGRFASGGDSLSELQFRASSG